MTFDRAALDRLYRYCWSLTNDEPSAYDLLQDGLERWLKTRHKHIDNPEAYLRRMLHNRFCDLLRQRKRRDEVSLEQSHLIDITASCEDLEALIIQRDQLAHVWAQLQAPERAILHLWAVEGLTAAQISDELGTPRGTILARIHRMRKRLRGTDASAAVEVSS